MQHVHWVPLKSISKLWIGRGKFHSTSLVAGSILPWASPIVSRYFALLHYSSDISHLRHLHARLIRNFLYDDVVLTSKLVLAYSHHQKLDQDAVSVFYTMPVRNIYSWNIIIGEFSRSGQHDKAVNLFLLMWRGHSDGVRPDEYSLPLVLRSFPGSNSAVAGIPFHVICIKLGFGESKFVGSALVSMYVNLNLAASAKKVFDEIPERDSVLWTAILAGCAQHEEPTLGLQVYREMISDGINRDWVVMVSLFSICGQLGSLKQGKSIHSWCVRNCAGSMDINLGNAIVDFYVKCAYLVYARRFFDRMTKRDVVSCSSLMLGYGMSGNFDEALRILYWMIETDFKPNDVTFLGLLSSCNHGGLVEEARLIFKMMKEECGLVPGMKHYASMVSCLARTGHLEEAERMICEMPMKPDAAVLGALLFGCRDFNNVEMGERIWRKLMCLEPDRSCYYVVLSNLYAQCGGFCEAEGVRELMKSRNLCKVPGFALPV